MGWSDGFGGAGSSSLYNAPLYQIRVPPYIMLYVTAPTVQSPAPTPNKAPELLCDEAHCRQAGQHVKFEAFGASNAVAQSALTRDVAQSV